MSRYFITSESVTEGHPDKICDQISDAILDEILKQDPDAHVACETTCTTGIVNIMGEITTTADVDIPAIARKTIIDIGYDSSEKGFDGNTCAIVTSIDKQSPDINMGVSRNNSKDIEDSIGAGDQGMMFGYACNETPALMPVPIYLAHKLAKKLADVRKSGELPYLRPDGKTQVTVEYEDGIPVGIDTVVVSTQHDPDVELSKLQNDIIKHVINPTIIDKLPEDMKPNIKFYINPTGRFVIGGPAGDSGLTGRKIVVDSYGGIGHVGGGCQSGKDPSKVDRSAFYAARWVAKNIVAAGLADRCEVQFAYAIGVPHPVSMYVNTFGTCRNCTDDVLSQAVQQVFDLRPYSIIRNLNLKHTTYKDVAAYGHVGREDLPVAWETVNKDEDLLFVVNNLMKQD